MRYGESVTSFLVIVRLGFDLRSSEATRPYLFSCHHGTFGESCCMIRIEVVGSVVSKWGEGPIWWEGALYYVDIEGKKVIRFDPETGAEQSWDVGRRVGTVVVHYNAGRTTGWESTGDIISSSFSWCPPQAGREAGRAAGQRADPVRDGFTWSPSGKRAWRGPIQ